MIEIELTQGKFAIVDDEDADLLNFNWHTTKGYARRNSSRSEGKQHPIYMHRVIASRMKSVSIVSGFEIDHVDGDKLNNRRSNLRLVTHAENMLNSPKQSNNKSGYKGVTFHKVAQKWAAQIGFKWGKYHLGLFASPEEAYMAYCEAAKRLHKTFARFE